jgi:hypothetical protein
VTHRGSGLPFSPKMDVFQAEISGDQGFVTGGDADAGTIIPNPENSSCVASTLTDATNESFFGKWQGRPMIREVLKNSVGLAMGAMFRDGHFSV